MPTVPLSSRPPVLLDTSSTGSADATQIILDFDTAMAAGSGVIYVTDGAVQTVIDRVTGLPTMRIVGGTDTHAIALADVHVDGTRVTLDVSGLLAEHQYSVVMGAGVLVSSQHVAYGGVRAPAQVEFTTPSVGPHLLSADSDNDLLQAGGNGIVVTLHFSEAVTNLPADALSAPNATLGAISSSDGGLTWTVKLAAPSAALADEANVLRLDLSKLVDATGHHGSGTSDVAHYAVDTVLQGWVANIDLTEDSGPSDSDGVTNSAYLSIGGSFGGDVAYGEHVEFTVDGGEVHYISVYPDEGGTVRGWDYYDDGEALDDGTHTISAHLVDGEGHVSATLTRTITIDTQAPQLTAAPVVDGVLDAASALVLRFDEAVYWTDTSSSTDGIALRDVTAGTTVYLNLGTANFSADHKTVTLGANQLQLTAGHDYQVSLPSTLTDLAGNQPEIAPIAFRATGTHADTTPPTASAVITTDGGLHGIGSWIGIRVAFDEAVQAVEGKTIPGLALNNGGVAVYDGFDAQTRQLMFHYAVQDGDTDTTHLDIADKNQLAGFVEDLAHNALDAAHIAYAHLSATDGYGNVLAVQVDAHAPATPGTPHLDAASDDGVAGDGITSMDWPTLSGTGDAGAWVELYVDGDGWVGSAQVRDDGSWSVDSHIHGAGTYAVTARQFDDAGNTSASSAVFNLTIAPPAPPPAPPTPGAPALAEGSDTGSDHTDNLTSNPTPTLTGTAEQGGGQMLVYVDDQYLGSAPVDTNGAWSYALAGAQALHDGPHAFNVAQVGAGDQTSGQSAALTVTVDTHAPTLANPDPGITGNGSGTWMTLEFDEGIVFDHGVIDIFDRAPADGGDVIATYFADGHGQPWHIETANGHAVLELAVDLHTLPGTVWIQVSEGALQDAAGNAAIVGSGPYILPLA